MTKPRTLPKDDTHSGPEKPDDLLREARERFSQAAEAEHHNREAALEDLRFLAGEQWPDKVRREREADGRPCLTVNRLPALLDQVVGDARQNKPSIKVRPVDSGSDPAVAEVLEGLIRNIEYASNADTAYDTALEQSAGCGFGYFRIVTEYCADDTFDQDIRIRRILNPFTVYMDPDCQEADCSDARFCFVSETIDKKEFERLHPGAESASGMDLGLGDDRQHWSGEGKVRVAEYWYREPSRKTICLLSDGSVADRDSLIPEVLAELAARGLSVARERQVEGHRIMWCKLSGSRLLDAPRQWPGRYIPVVRVSGKELHIEGRTHCRGLIRFAKDPQRMYNYWRSVATETVALAPKVPWLVTPEQIEGHEPMWAEANVKSFPYLPYNPVPDAPLPQRMSVPQIPAGAIQEALNASDDLKATTGIYDAAMGARSNETSGRAIMARQREGDVATFAYIDNLARSIRFAGKILVDLIPRIYDTARIIRVRGNDDLERFVQINTAAIDPLTGRQVIVNDLSQGKYDVVVTVGPSYTTQRIEAAESMIQFAQAVPQAAATMADLMAESMDWPKADEIARRLRQILPPGLTEPQEGKEAMQQTPPPPPDPGMELEERRLRIQEMESRAKVAQIQADTMLKLAQAEAQEPGRQIDMYRGQLTALQGSGLDTSSLIDRQAQEAIRAGADPAAVIQRVRDLGYEHLLGQQNGEPAVEHQEQGER